jgi:hypothetical protein
VIRIPWKCRRLVVGTGAYGDLPVMDEVKHERYPAHHVLIAAIERRADPNKP